jgi:hypothetical protein
MKLHRALSSAIVLILITASSVAAQSTRPIDVTGQFSTLALANLDATSVGVGGRVNVGLSRWLSFDGEFSVYPNDNFTEGGGFFPAGDGLTFKRRRLEGLAGVKIGWRNDRVGVFGKVRPGFVHLTNRGVDCAGDVCALILVAVPEYKTEFAFDLGGIVEFYPTARTVARVDIGDLEIQHRSLLVPMQCSTCTTHNFSTRVGFGMRF